MNTADNKLLICGAAITMAVCMGSCSSKDTDYDATGNFEATEITVSAEATGQLRSFNVEEGQTVKSGAVLGNIDTDQLSMRLDELSADQRQIEASQKQFAASKGAMDSKVLDMQRQVASIEQQISNARRERQRYAELVRDGAAPQRQVDEYDEQIKVLQKQLDATREQISSTNEMARQQSRSAMAQMEGARANSESMDSRKAQIGDQISKAAIKAPLDGTVIEKYAETGEYVTIGKPLFKVADLTNVFLRAYITSGQLENVKVGSHVKVYADYGNGERKAYDGVVTWISGKSEFTPKTILTDNERADLVYAVKIRVKNDGGIKIGMYGEVKL